MSSSRRQIYCSQLLQLLLLVIVWRIEAFSSPSPTHAAQVDDNSSSTRRRMFIGGIHLATAAATALIPIPAMARLESVNRPDLLPSEPDLKVIQIEKFLTTGQAKRMNELLTALERDTQFRVRVLCQAYPMTPGLAMYVLARAADSGCPRCLLLIHSVAQLHTTAATTGISEKKARKTTDM